MLGRPVFELSQILIDMHIATISLVFFTLVLHLAQTCLEQSSHLHPRLKNPNLVFMHRKQTLLFSTSSLRLPSKGKPSSSALVNTVRMCTTSSKVKSKVCKAVAQCSYEAKISLRLANSSGTKIRNWNLNSCYLTPPFATVFKNH